VLSHLCPELVYLVHARPLVSVAVGRDRYSVGYSPPVSRPECRGRRAAAATVTDVNTTALVALIVGLTTASVGLLSPIITYRFVSKMDHERWVRERRADAYVRVTAMCLDFNLNVMVLADGGPDGEGAAGQARMAVQGGVGREFGGAQDRVICPRIVAEHHAQVRAYSADVLSAAWVDGSERGCVGCWGVHGSSR